MPLQLCTEAFGDSHIGTVDDLDSSQRLPIHFDHFLSSVFIVSIRLTGSSASGI